VRVTSSPVAQLNRLVAVSMAAGLEVAYRELGALEGSLGDYSCYHAARGDLLRRLDQRSGARSAYERALALATNPKQRASLARAAAELD
jgi:RNA polymerase sigma-70 factor (ECF subfamily)